MLRIEVTPEGAVVCAWVARCGNTTTKALDHPILGLVPCCDRCAGAHVDELVEFDITAMEEIL